MAHTPPFTLTGACTIMGLVGTFKTKNLDGTTLSAETKSLLTGASLSRNTPGGTLEDANGNVLCEGYGRPQDSISIEWSVISAANPPTVADAEANLVVALGGSIATLGDTGVLLFDGDWNCAADWKVVAVTKGAMKLSGTLTRKGTLTGGIPTALAVRS